MSVSRPNNATNLVGGVDRWSAHHHEDRRLRSGSATLNAFGNARHWKLSAVAASAAFAITALALLLAIPAEARLSTPTAQQATSTVYDWGWESPLPQGHPLNGVSCPTADGSYVKLRLRQKLYAYQSASS